MPVVCKVVPREEAKIVVGYPEEEGGVYRHGEKNNKCNGTAFHTANC